MDESKPKQGGVVTILQLIAMLSVICALVGGALANLSLAAETGFMVSAVIAAAFLWACASVVQELRNIEFNTRKTT